MSWIQTNGGLYIGSRVMGWPVRVSVSSNVMDAVGESTAGIGRIYLSTGPGTSAVLDSTGYIVTCAPGSAVTYANASTTITAGVQGVTGATGIEDGTYVVYGTDVGGSGLYAQSKVSEMPMSTGSMTIAHGDLIAIVVEMTARGGVDSIRVGMTTASGQSFPYHTQDSGAGPAKGTAAMQVMIRFGNGVVGAFNEDTMPSIHPVATSFNSGSAYSEYGCAMTIPCRMEVDRLVGAVGELDSGETGELRLYAEPFSGTPLQLASVSVDPLINGLVASGVGHHELPLSTRLVLERGQQIAVTYIATSAGSREITWRLTGTGAGKMNWCGEVKSVRRGGGSGAFGEVSGNLPYFGLVASALDIPEPTPRTRIVKGL